jgi:hypothetical protein
MFLAFADNTFIPRIEQSLTRLIDDMEKSLEAITKLLKQSGLVVNQSKTEICLFHRRDNRPITIEIGLETIVSRPVINVLVVIFYSKLQWSNQVANNNKKSKQSRSAITQIIRFFNTR